MGLVAGNLLPQSVDALDEITLLVKQADGNKGQGEITGRFAVVSCKNAKAARVDGKALVKAEFGAEVRHQCRFRVQLFGYLRPGARLQVGIVTAQYSAIFRQERAVFGRLIQPVLGDTAQKQLGVMLDFLPEPQVNPGKQAAHPVIPAVEQIIRQLFKTRKSLGDKRVGLKSEFCCLVHVNYLRAGTRSR